MPEDDEYKISVNGGRLKIKGVQDGRVTKKKKSKRKGETSSRKVEKQLQSGQSMDGAHDGQDDKKEPEGQQKTDDEDNDPLKGKTKAEIAYHEMNRKRAHQRLQREGIKTHKERVEDFNRYLSTLSEHHDMPRIGPG